MNEGELASLVRGALQLPPGAADVAEVSENGSGKTYRVCAGGTTVALRLTPPDERDCFFTRRMQAAARAFAGAGLGPRPIAEGDGPNGGGWWVEEWGGSRSLPWTSREEYAAMGRLLARMHAVPTEWFDASRAEAVRRWPLLERVTAGSHAWVGLAWGLWEVREHVCRSPMARPIIHGVCHRPPPMSSPNRAIQRTWRLAARSPPLHRPAAFLACQPHHPSDRRLLAA